MSVSGLEAVLQRVEGRVEDEIELLKEDFENAVSIDLDELPHDTKKDLRAIHYNLHLRRIAIYEESAKGGTVDKVKYFPRIEASLKQALEDIQDLLGEELYMKIFQLLPQEAANMLFCLR